MHINRKWFHFYRDEVPNWICPSCNSDSLNLKDDDLWVYESGETTNSKSMEWFDVDYVRYRFSATLKCANLRCNEVVAVIGAGEVETDHIPNEEGKWAINYRDCFTPRFFEPCLIPISIPENTSANVIKALFAAFSIIFSNRDAAANQLRLSIEVLLDDMGVKARDKNGGFLNLGVRINDHLSEDFRLLKFKDRLSAIQWIGNDGSHGNGAISHADLLAGLEIIESLLVELYPSPGADLDELARQMIDKKKPKRGIR